MWLPSLWHSLPEDGVQSGPPGSTFGGKGLEYRWYVELTGHPLDLLEMQERLRTGPSRITQIDGKWYIGSRKFQDETVESIVYKTAAEILSTLNLAFSIASSGHEAIKLGSSVIENTPTGRQTSHTILFLGGVSVRARASVGSILVDGIPLAPTTSLPEKLIELADQNDDFHATLRTFNADPPSFSDLYIVFETVKKALDPLGNNNPDRGKDEIVRLEWASESELSRLYRTAQFYRHGYPRKPLALGCEELPLSDATALVRRLLHLWAEKLWQSLHPEPTSAPPAP